MADVPVTIFRGRKTRAGTSPSIPSGVEGEPLPPVNPPGSNPIVGSKIHNDLEEIQGGIEGERYHLTLAEKNSIGGGGGSQVIPFSTVINMTGNFKARHIQTGPIAYTRGSFPTPLLNFGNETRHYVTANGTGGQPTFSSDFVLQMNTWSNNIGDINQIIHQGSPSGKILVWVDNVELA